MATSGSVNYVVNRDEIITEALQLVGVLGEGESPTASQLTDCARTLNMLAKAWSNKGLKAWLSEEVILFPVKNQNEYTFAVTGADRMCLSSEFIGTKLNGSHAASATTLTVDSTTGMAASDVIGVVTDDSGIHWTTIVSVDSATALTITSGLSSTASDNDRVYTYTNAFTQDIADLTQMWTSDADDNDIPMRRISQQEYMYWPEKTENGRPNAYWFDNKLNSALVHIWQVPDDSYTDHLLYCNVRRLIEDFDAATDDADFPQQWYMALSYNLALYLSPKYGVPAQTKKDIAGLAMELRKEAEAFSVPNDSIYFTVGVDYRD